MRLLHGVVRLAPAVAAVAILACSAAAQSRASAAPARLVGRVVALDDQARTLDLLTGVGHALRIHHVHVPGGVAIKYQGMETSMSRLTRGCTVLIACGGPPSRPEATTVELLEVAPGAKP